MFPRLGIRHLVNITSLLGSLAHTDTVLGLGQAVYGGVCVAPAMVNQCFILISVGVVKLQYNTVINYICSIMSILIFLIDFLHFYLKVK